MTASKIRKQIIKTTFDFNYKRESGIHKYIKVILNNGKTYNCTDIELYANNVDLMFNTEKVINLSYTDIKKLELY